jgi:hypothetical protein
MTRGFIARLARPFAEIERRTNPRAVSESAFDEVHVLQRQPEMNCENLHNLLRKEGVKTRIIRL